MNTNDVLLGDGGGSDYEPTDSGVRVFPEGAGNLSGGGLPWSVEDNDSGLISLVPTSNSSNYEWGLGSSYNGESIAKFVLDVSLAPTALNHTLEFSLREALFSISFTVSLLGRIPIIVSFNERNELGVAVGYVFVHEGYEYANISLGTKFGDESYLDVELTGRVVGVGATLRVTESRGFDREMRELMRKARGFGQEIIGGLAPQWSYPLEY